MEQPWPCHTKPRHQWCDHDGPGGFMGHTCRNPLVNPDMPRAEQWRGIGKLTEECGEVLQLLGKGIAFPSGDHPDGLGAIRDRLPAELADLKAAIAYFEEANGLNRREDRVKEKLEKFRKWGLTGVHDLGAKAYG